MRIGGNAAVPGCSVRISVGTDEYLTGEDYPDAEKYRAGAFTYNSDEIKKVEVYWRFGEVKLVESDGLQLGVKESGSNLTEERALHYLMDNGVLRIRFCKAGAKTHVNEKDKHLRLEIPKGIELSVHTTSAAVKADTLAQKDVLIAALDGDMELGAAAAENIDLSSGAGDISADSITAQIFKCSTSSGSVKAGSIVSETAEITTGSGNVESALKDAPAVKVRTSVGKVSLTLPADGAEVSYISDGGKLLSDCAFERKGDLYVFGGGKSKVTIETLNGNAVIK